MGFLDDLDDALDAAFDSPSTRAPSTPAVVDAPELDALALSEAIVAEKSRAVACLARVLDHGRRRWALAALDGALACLAEANMDPERGRVIEAMRGLTRTARGTLRQRLRPDQRAALSDLAERLERPYPNEPQAALAFLKALQDEVLPKTVHGLYAAGIWRAEQAAKAQAQELTELAGATPVQAAKAIRAASRLLESGDKTSPGDRS